VEDADVRSRLTRAGYLQCPDWLFTVPHGEFHRYREAWYQSFEGRMIILKASMRETADKALEEMGLRRRYI
jgi:hypothetical protein